MKVGVPIIVIAMVAILVMGCAGNEIAPATSDAPAPGNGDPLAALYAAPPAGAAFITVSDVEADIVGPDALPFDPFYGYGYAAELVVPFVDRPWGAPFEDLGLGLAASDAVPLPVHVDIDAHFAAAIAAAAADAQPVVWERGPETQQPLPEGWEAPPLDAK